MISTKHLTEARLILREHCYHCRNKGIGCAVCHVEKAIVEIECAQAARQAEPPKVRELSPGQFMNADRVKADRRKRLHDDGSARRTVWCNNSDCAWNSRINQEPNDGEQCLFTGELTLEVAGFNREALVCTDCQAPLSRREWDAKDR